MEQSELRLGIIGLGYVGLTAAAGFAEMGFSVLGTDSDQGKLDALRRGEVPFYEPDLQELLVKHTASGQLTLVTDTATVVAGASVLFICVGTPQGVNGRPDLSMVEQVAKTIARNMREYRLIVEKSTVPVTTAGWIKNTVASHTNGTVDFDVAANPEFLREGHAVHDFLHPDRIVLGAESKRARGLLERLYAPFDSPLVLTDLNTAEVIKHASNAFLATRISFINMVSDICEATGADVTKVATGMGLDPRIGPAYLAPGLGYGGSCLPKDVRAFIHAGRDLGADLSLLESVEAVNTARVDRLIEKLVKKLDTVEGKRIAVLGLSFKPGTDDIRESPSIKVIEQLRDAGALLRVHDPRASEIAQQQLPEVPGLLEYCSNVYDAAQGADALLLLTAWPEYSELDLSMLRELLSSPIVVDGRNVFDPAEMRELGFEYTSIGRP